MQLLSASAEEPWSKANILKDLLEIIFLNNIFYAFVKSVNSSIHKPLIGGSSDLKGCLTRGYIESWIKKRIMTMVTCQFIKEGSFNISLH